MADLFDLSKSIRNISLGYADALHQGMEAEKDLIRTRDNMNPKPTIVPLEDAINAGLFLLDDEQEATLRKLPTHWYNAIVRHLRRNATMHCVQRTIEHRNPLPTEMAEHAWSRTKSWLKEHLWTQKKPYT
jgi:hypothetical protein